MTKGVCLMSRTFKDMTPAVRQGRRDRERRRTEAGRRAQRKARQLSMQFATRGKLTRVRVPTDVLARLELLYR